MTYLRRKYLFILSRTFLQKGFQLKNLKFFFYYNVTYSKLAVHILPHDIPVEIYVVN